MIHRKEGGEPFKVKELQEIIRRATTAARVPSRAAHRPQE
jgi:hypothetical protein